MIPQHELDAKAERDHYHDWLANRPPGAGIPPQHIHRIGWEGGRAYEQERLAATGPVWTRNPPTVEGWYRWHSTIGTTHMLPVRAYGAGMGMSHDGVVADLPAGGWWLGPIISPPAPSATEEDGQHAL